MIFRVDSVTRGEGSFGEMVVKYGGTLQSELGLEDARLLRQQSIAPW